MTDEEKPQEARHYVLKAEPAFVNLSPVGFRIWAKQY